MSTRGSKRGCVHSSQCDYALVSSSEIDTDSLEMHILCELSLYIAKALPRSAAALILVVSIVERSQDEHFRVSLL